jgi:Fic family protein
VGGDRESVGAEPDLLTDPDEIARKEAENAVRQFDAVLDLIDYVARDGREFRLRPSTILSLHKLALDGLSRYAGTWRPSAVSIEKSGHKPPHESDVPRLIEEMCDWVNDNWANETALKICAYLMWRLNWIHPFLDGNGRTSRAVSYLALCAKLGDRLPGTTTIPEQIAAGRDPYYTALEAADLAHERGELDISAMEELLRHYLGVQLSSTFDQADKVGGDDRPDRKLH